MVTRIRSLNLDATHPRLLGAFWSAALQWHLENANDDRVELAPDADTGFPLVIRKRSPLAKVEKNRVHLDLTTTSARDQTETVAQLLAIGARHIDIGQRPDESHVVLADPEDNEFCVIEPENSFLSSCPRLGCINCEGPPSTGYFWSEVLGWPLVWDQDQQTAIQDPDRHGPIISWDISSTEKVMRNRLTLTILADQELGTGGTRNWLVSLGARPDAAPDVGVGVAMIDPGGNEFVLSSE